MRDKELAVIRRTGDTRAICNALILYWETSVRHWDRIVARYPFPLYFKAREHSMESLSKSHYFSKLLDKLANS